MAVDYLTAEELASVGVPVGTVPGVSFIGMTPNELKEALDRRGIGYDRALLGQMQNAYADLFGSKSKGTAGAKKAKDEDLQVIIDEEKDLVNAYNSFSPDKGAPPAKAGPQLSDLLGKATFSFQEIPGWTPPSEPPPSTSLFTDPFFSSKNKEAPPSSVVPGLPTPANNASEVNTGEDFGKLDPEYGAKSPSEALAGNRSSGGYQGVPGANPPAGYDMLATGDVNNAMAPGGRLNSGGWDKGKDGGLGGGTGAGQGAGSGPSGGDPGSSAGGVGGVGSGGMGTGGGQGEGGNGGWMMGTADTGDDGDMMPDEEVDPPVHENEAVLPEDMRNDLGKDLLAEAISFYQDEGLTPRERKAALKDLFGEWASK